MSYVIRNAKIYDGTGKSAYVADVLISGGVIEKIGSGLTGDNVIDARGLCLSPGFIDAHTHSDSQLFVDKDRKHKLLMGVTAEVGGQCGWSRAPIKNNAPKAALDFFDTVMGNKIIRRFDTFGEYMDEMKQLKLGAHQKTFTGHCMIRGSVIGMENRQATKAELEYMCDLMEESMKAGSLGLSTGLVYAPACYANTEELVALAKVAAKYGGMFTIHMRNESDFVEESVKEAINIAKQAKIKLNISHLKAMFPQNYHKTEKILKLIDDAAIEGVDISFDVYPYTACSANMNSTLPPSYNSHDLDWLVEHLTGEENLEILRDIIYNEKEHWENPIKNIGFEKMLIARGDKTPDAVGKTIKEYADLLGIEPLAAYAKIVADNRLSVSDIRFCMSEDEIEKLYKHPLCMLGTDGLYRSDNVLSHPRHFGSFPRYLGRFVREKKILPFAEAIHRITEMPADRYGFKNKGVIKEGYDADLVIFDENTIIDHAEYLDPFIPNDGIKAVFVMGEIAVKDNEYTGLLNGKFYER